MGSFGNFLFFGELGIHLRQKEDPGEDISDGASLRRLLRGSPGGDLADVLLFPFSSLPFYHETVTRKNLR
jgi:hypothetical protein